MDNKFIITTTIYEPSEAIIKYSQLKDWKLIVVGDKKTPHKEYEKLDCIYLHPDYQEKKYKKLSDVIEWNTANRRNIGHIEAYKLGAKIVASVDDDVIPYDTWGENLLVDKEIECDYYETDYIAFDPFSVTKRNDVWHRGFPFELISTKNNVVYKGKQKRTVLIQADLCDGESDLDAMCGMMSKPNIKYDITESYCSNRISPFNCQNIFLHRNVLPYYVTFPFIDRLDDVWGAFVAQHYFPNNLVYNKASAYHDRDIHRKTKPEDRIVDLEKEIFGYKNTLNFLKNINNFKDLLPDKTRKFWKLYRECFK